MVRVSVRFCGEGAGREGWFMMPLVTVSRWEVKCDGKACCRAIESTTSMKKRSDFMSYYFGCGWIINHKGKYLCGDCWNDEVRERYGDSDGREES